MAKKLSELLERLNKDEAFRKRVIRDKKALSELGWSPQAIAQFEVKGYRRGKNCGKQCGCTAKIGQGCSGKVGGTVGEGAMCGSQCGCTAAMGQGCTAKAGHTCSGGSGAGTK